MNLFLSPEGRNPVSNQILRLALFNIPPRLWTAGIVLGREGSCRIVDSKGHLGKAGTSSSLFLRSAFRGAGGPCYPLATAFLGPQDFFQRPQSQDQVFTY